MSGRMIFILTTVHKTFSSSVSADEQELLVGTDQAWLVRLSTRDLSILGTVSKGHTQEVVGISISSSNNGNDNFNHGNGISNNNGNGNSNNDNNGKDDLYCSISSDGSLNVYDLESLVLISTFKRHNKIRGTSIFAINNKNNSNSRFILTGWSDGKVQCYRISAPTPMSSSSVSEPTLCWEILAAQHTVTSIYHCELYMATGASDGTISLWSNATRQNLAFFNAHGGEVSRIFTHLSDPSLLISSGDRTLTTFSLKTETKRERVRIRDGAITGMAHLSPVGFTTSSSSPPFTHNNRYSANNQYTQNNNQQPHVQPPNRSHQNHNVLTCDTRGCLRVWDFYQYDPNSAVLSINVSNQALCCLAVSASGRYVATGGEERTVFVYEVVQSQSSEYMLELVSVCNGHTGSIKDISFSTDERSIVSVGEDSSLCVWDINTHQY